MAAFKICGQLHFVHSHKINRNVLRHGLHGANPIAGTVWFDFFFTRKQSHMLRAYAGNQLVINLSGKQTQRQSNNARVIGAHALNSIMGFTRVGGAEHGHNPF